MKATFEEAGSDRPAIDPTPGLFCLSLAFCGVLAALTAQYGSVHPASLIFGCVPPEVALSLRGGGADICVDP